MIHRSVVTRVIVLGLAMLLLATSASHSAQSRIALVVGNSAYTNVPALPNPANDAADVSQSLQRLGFNVTTVTDAKFDAFRQALIEFGRAARGADMAVVFFAGHGVEIAGENWLLPVDVEMKNDLDADTEALSLRSAMLAVSNAKRFGLVILDACRNNPFADKTRGIRPSPVTDAGLAPVEPNGNVLVAYAARDGTTARDGTGRNSPYTTALLRHIETAGLEVEFLFRNVRDDVMSATDDEQQPFVYGSLSRRAIYLAGEPSPAEQAATKQANAAPAVAAAPAPVASVIDPALVGTWEIMVPGDRGMSRWIWRIMGDGTYAFHAEGRRPAPAHEGTIAAMNGHWSLHASRGLNGHADGGSYEVRDATAVITGKLGTGYWKRSLQ